MAERLKARPAILDRRREVVEHPFGSIKQWMYQGAFLMRGLANVRTEFSLTALAYRKAPPARSRTRASLIGVLLNAKSSTSLASGSLATVSWYLIERAW